MPTRQDFVDYVLEQADLPGRLSTRKMFGEYALYLDDKVVAFLCDDQVFIKPTDEGRRLLGTVTEAPPYPGAKLHFQINEQLDDRDIVRPLLLCTAQALPMPKPKAPRRAPADGPHATPPATGPKKTKTARPKP